MNRVLLPVMRYNSRSPAIRSGVGGFALGIESLLIMLLIGAIAGWLAGQIVSGFGYGLLGNIIVGVVGAFVAGAILPRVGFGMGGGILAAIVHSTIGAVILLFLIKLIKRA